jgi:hypothetical protein
MRRLSLSIARSYFSDVSLRFSQPYRVNHRRVGTLKMIDRFQYNYDVPAEDIEFYCPGGYHPTHLNDLLKGGQYQILHKLGFGSFATVWLARDNR